jgi:hypothetical protein
MRELSNKRSDSETGLNEKCRSRLKDSIKKSKIWRKKLVSYLKIVSYQMLIGSRKCDKKNSNIKK